MNKISKILLYPFRLFYQLGGRISQAITDYFTINEEEEQARIQKAIKEVHEEVRQRKTSINSIGIAFLAGLALGIFIAIYIMR